MNSMSFDFFFVVSCPSLAWASDASAMGHYSSLVVGLSPTNGA
jgi:hypothetical protein